MRCALGLRLRPVRALGLRLSHHFFLFVRDVSQIARNPAADHWGLSAERSPTRPPTVIQTRPDSISQTYRLNTTVGSGSGWLASSAAEHSNPETMNTVMPITKAVRQSKSRIVNRKG